MRRLMPQLSARQAIAIGKGVLAYLLAFILIFLRPFNSLNPYPITLTGVVLVTIAGTPGKTVGACLDAAFVGGLGVLLGAAGFAVLAKLGHAPVAQGFLFAIFVYFLALVKAKGLRYFGFSLLAIIMCFSGIYTSVLLGGRFEPRYLIAYLRSYFWGFAIVLFVNVFILPVTSERELREVICRSVEHISLFAHLISKTYRLELTDEERKARDSLNLSIRADYGFLTQKLSETSLELNWSRWSMHDYNKAVQLIRQMQQGLITSYSSLVTMEQYNPAALSFVKDQMTSDDVARNFAKLRRTADLIVDDIIRELAVSNIEYHLMAPGATSWQDFREDDKSDVTLDVEQQQETRGRSRTVISAHERDILRDRLRKEVESTTVTPIGSRAPSPTRASANEKPPSHSSNEDQVNVLPKVSEIKALERPSFLRTCWSTFEKSQNNAVVRILKAGLPGDAELWLHKPGASLHDTYKQPTAGAQAWNTKSFLPRGVMPSPPIDVDEPTVMYGDAQSARSTDFVCGTAVMRTFSFLFGMGQMVNSLAELHEHIVASQAKEPRKKKLRLHLFERTAKQKAQSSMCVKEAVARLQGRQFHKPRTPFLVRFAQLERILRSDTSVFAFKVAAAVSVFSVFLLAPSLRQFFVDYRLTGGLITVVVAVLPTVGGSLFTWVLQVLGTGFGSLYGMVVLLIFRHVGGYYFNPYGIVCLLLPLAIAMSYVIYQKPIFFSGALLCLNGAGTVIVTSWVYRESFDAPPLTFAKALVAMAIALGIAAFFQILILRRPARRTLRKDIAKITYALSSYTQLLTAYNEAVLPAEVSHLEKPLKPAPEALKAVQAELIRREASIQMALLGLLPTFKFASLEPNFFGHKFQGGVIMQVVRAHQIILDRLREGRVALSNPDFSEVVKKDFVEPLAPYRRQARKYNRVLFYLVATSIATKVALPTELPSMVTVSRALQHDAMVLSQRLANAHGDIEQSSQDSSFIRFWFFLVSFSSVAFQLENLEDLLRQLFALEYLEGQDPEDHDAPSE